MGENHDIAVLLISKGADPKGKTFGGGLSPIRCALQHGDMEMVTLLTENGVRVSEEASAADLAAYSGNVEVLEYVLSQGGNLEADRDGDTPLHTAAVWGHTDMVEFLCDRGMDVNAQDVDGRTPLHLASALNDIAILQILLKNGADVHVKNDDGATAADIATEEECKGLLEKLK